MPNIMVNEVCNLRCPYCFASEFVNHNPREITVEDFRKALEFVLSDRDAVQVGIIGGEPTLYSHINEVLEIAMEDIRACPVAVYTNAISLEKIKPELLENRKFRMLVNCNSPEDMGAEKYDKMRRNIHRFIREHFGAGRFRLSVNLYKPDFDYRYVLDLAKEFSCGHIRLSISVPSRGSLPGQSDPMAYFRSMKDVVTRLTKDLCSHGVIPGFDCNFMPLCVYTDQEFQDLFAIKRQLMTPQHSPDFWMRSIISEQQTCSPVIDILPDLTAVRCFGLSEDTKQNIRDHKDAYALERYYRKAIDLISRDYYSSEACKDCFKRRNRKCSGGCYIYKIDKIMRGEESSSPPIAG